MTDKNQTGFVSEMKDMMTAIAGIAVSVTGCGLWFFGAMFVVLAIFGEGGSMPWQMLGGAMIAFAGGAILWWGRFVNRRLVTFFLNALVFLGALQIPFLMFMPSPWPFERTKDWEFLLVGAATLVLLWRLKASWKKRDSAGR